MNDDDVRDLRRVLARQVVVLLPLVVFTLAMSPAVRITVKAEIARLRDQYRRATQARRDAAWLEWQRRELAAMPADYSPADELARDRRRAA
jgi:hypothetical protein